MAGGGGDDFLRGAGPSYIWWSEKKDYDFDKPGFAANTGHFTQIVWKSTKKIGCGFGKKGSKMYVVCQYYPAGNMLGSFPGNVLRDAPNSKDNSCEVFSLINTYMLGSFPANVLRDAPNSKENSCEVH